MSDDKPRPNYTPRVARIITAPTKAEHDAKVEETGLPIHAAGVVAGPAHHQATTGRGVRMTTCPNCACLIPADEDPEHCRICKAEGCLGCVGSNGLCDLCHDIEEERWKQ